MLKLKKIFLAALLTTGAMLSSPKPSLALSYCQSCARAPECLVCCLCAGGIYFECVRQC
jgi:hypothetical protein